MSTLSVVQIRTIKDLIDTLADLNVSPLHLHIDAKKVGDLRPDISIWMQSRTDFERICARFGIKATERRYSPEGQRSWSAEHDTPERRLLMQCASFAHHADWEPRRQPEVAQGALFDGEAAS